jgi:hypothetical protein
MEVLSIAEIELDPACIAKRLRVVDNGLVRRLTESVKAVIAPAVTFRISYVDERLDDSVVIDGIRFTSRVLYQNLDGVGRVFPFVLTLGKTLENVIEATRDMLEKYLLDEIGNMALIEARGRFEQHLRSTFTLEKISCMAPGSLENWPIEQQRILFNLLCGVESAIGVSLTESCLMIPRKSISGIYFPSEVTFFSCQLCPRERCESRKARFNEEMAL